MLRWVDDERRGGGESAQRARLALAYVRQVDVRDELMTMTFAVLPCHVLAMKPAILARYTTTDRHVLADSLHAAAAAAGTVTCTVLTCH